MNQKQGLALEEIEELHKDEEENEIKKRVTKIAARRSKQEPIRRI